jgi:hypothetical protein
MEWAVVACDVLKRLGSPIAEQATAFVARGLTLVYGFGQSGNGVSDDGTAVRRVWTATATLPDGTREPLIGVNPVAATNPRDVFLSVMHGILLETCRPFAKVTGEKRDASGKVTKAGRLTLYGEAFTSACAGVLDSPRKPRKNGEPGKFAGSAAFLAAPALEAILPDILASLPPLPYHVSPEKAERNTVNLLLKSPAGRAYRCTARVITNEVKSITDAQAIVSDVESLGLTFNLENEPTALWLATYHKATTTEAAKADDAAA